MRTSLVQGVRRIFIRQDLVLGHAIVRAVRGLWCFDTYPFASGATGATGVFRATSILAVMYIIRALACPWGPAISISTPLVRNKDGIRRTRPPRSRGVLGHGLLLTRDSSMTAPRSPRRSLAVPFHSMQRTTQRRSFEICVRTVRTVRTIPSVIIASSALATGSPSSTVSTACSRLLRYALSTVPDGQTAVSHAWSDDRSANLQPSARRRLLLIQL